MVIGCCDSRVSPEVIFDARPGELFVVRNVANLVPPYSPDGTYHGVSAALEFGVGALRVKHIVVLGHARCGGVRAFAEDSAPLSPGDFIGKWMSLIAPAAEKLGPRGDAPPADYLARLEQASIVNTLGNLLTFPRLRKLIERGTRRVARSLFCGRDRRVAGARSAVRAVRSGGERSCSRVIRDAGDAGLSGVYDRMAATAFVQSARRSEETVVRSCSWGGISYTKAGAANGMSLKGAWKRHSPLGPVAQPDRAAVS